MGKAAGAILAIGAVVLSGGIAGALLGVTEGLGFLVARTVIAMGIMSLGSSLLGLNKTESAAGGVKASGILANEASNVASIPIVYGRRRVGTKRIYLNVSDSNQKLHMVMAVAEGQIGRIRRVYFNDELAISLKGGDTDPKGGTIPRQATNSGAYTSYASTGLSDDVINIGDSRICSKYRDYVRMEYRLGTTDQQYFKYLGDKFPEWASNAQCKGVALVYFELTFNRDVFNSVPTITVEIAGRQVTSVLSGDTYSTTFTGYTTSGSSTSLTLGTGSKSLTIPTDYSYGYQAGDSIELWASHTKYMGGTVTSYDSATGALVVNITYYYGSGSSTGWYAYNYTNWGVNPADVVYDYLTNPIFGKGLDADQIDTASFQETFLHCATVMRETFGTSTEVFSRYLINGHLVPDQTLYNNLKTILASFNGYLVYSNGKYQLKVNRARQGDELDDNNLFLFDETNMLGKFDVQLGTKQTRFNQVKVNYFDQDQMYNQNIIYYKNATYLTADNDFVLEREIELPMVTDTRNVNYLTRIILNQSRFGMTINFTAPYTALQVEVGDVVRITNTNMGFEEKLFRVLSMGLNMDGSIQITAMEYDDALYTTGTLPEIALPGTTTPAAGSSKYDTVVPPPTAVTAAASNTTQADGSVLSTIVVNWTASAGASTYEINLTGTTSGVYVTSGTSYTISGLANGTYYVGVRAVNAYGNKSTQVDA